MADNPRIEDLRRRLDREPGSRVFAQLAEELRKAGQLPEAIRVARQGLLVHPSYPSARMTLGRALMDLRDLRGARAEFEAVLRGATDNILASRFLGECLEGLGDLGSALLQFRATLRLAPGDRTLEAQIRALEQKLTPPATSTPGPPPLVPRPPSLPREGAIPVMDVDGPMELVASFDKPEPWRPAPPPVIASPPLAPAFGLPIAADFSPAVPVEDAQPAEAPAPAPEEVPFGSGQPMAEAPAAAAVEVAPPSGPESLNQSFPDDWDLPPPAAAEPSAPAPSGSEPAALSSSTLAELYFNQGFTGQAIDVYRELLEREPGNERIAARIVELQAIERALDGGPPVPPPAPVSLPADPKVLRREAIERTITRLEGFLAAVRRA